MAKREILAGATDQTIDVFIRDSSSATGGGLTGLAYNTASLTCYYRNGATGTPTALTLATQTVGGAHSDGGFVAVDGTNCPGQYRLDLSDTIIATAGMTYVYLRGAANMAPCVVEIEVVSVNKFDSVRMGMTALPNAAADAAGGLPISDLGGLDLDARLDAAITSRMASYTQPTGFLAATFPGNVASTTNITTASGVTLADASLTSAKFSLGSVVPGATGFLERLMLAIRFLIYGTEQTKQVGMTPAVLTMYADDGTTPLGEFEVLDDGTTYAKSPIQAP